jgi:hypothetical protein
MRQSAPDLRRHMLRPSPLLRRLVGTIGNVPVPAAWCDTFSGVTCGSVPVPAQ